MPELQSDPVQMLIGQDCPDILMPLEIRRGPASVPYATRTLLGWSVSGPVRGEKTDAMVNYISLERQVAQFWQIEGGQLNDSKGLFTEDRQALKIMDETVEVDEGRYTVAIPFREDHVLPNNRIMAEKRLGSLTKKLEKNEDLKKAYTDRMATLLQKGHAERVPGDSPAAKSGNEWYIPHHPVVSPNKSKIRVVFDCAAKYEEVALNIRCCRNQT